MKIKISMLFEIKFLYLVKRILYKEIKNFDQLIFFLLTF